MNNTIIAEIITNNGESFEVPYNGEISEERFTSELFAREVVGVYGHDNDYFVFPTRNILCVHFKEVKEKRKLPEAHTSLPTDFIK